LHKRKFSNARTIPGVTNVAGWSVDRLLGCIVAKRLNWSCWKDSFSWYDQ